MKFSNCLNAWLKGKRVMFILSGLVRSSLWAVVFGHFLVVFLRARGDAGSMIAWFSSTGIFQSGLGILFEHDDHTVVSLITKATGKTKADNCSP